MQGTGSGHSVDAATASSSSNTSPVGGGAASSCSAYAQQRAAPSLAIACVFCLRQARLPVSLSACAQPGGSTTADAGTGTGDAEAAKQRDEEEERGSASGSASQSPQRRSNGGGGGTREGMAAEGDGDGEAEGVQVQVQREGEGDPGRDNVFGHIACGQCVSRVYNGECGRANWCTRLGKPKPPTFTMENAEAMCEAMRAKDAPSGFVHIRCPMCGSATPVPNSSGIPRLLKVMCDVCEQKPFSQFCKTCFIRVCDTRFCVKATANLHKKLRLGHQFIAVDVPVQSLTPNTCLRPGPATENICKEVSEMAKRVATEIDNISKALLCFSLTRKTLEENCTKIKDQINLNFAKLHLQLSQRQNYLISVLDQIETSTDTLLLSQESFLSLHTLRLKRAIEAANSISTRVNSRQLHQIFTKYLLSLCNEEVLASSICCSSITFDSSMDILQGQLNYGQFTFGTTSRNLTVSVPTNFLPPSSPTINRLNTPQVKTSAGFNQAEEDFAYQTLVLFAEGNYSETYKRCLAIQEKVDSQQQQYADAVAYLLLSCIFDLQPSLFHHRSYAVYPLYDYLDKSRGCTPSSHQFTLRLLGRMTATTSPAHIPAVGHYLIGFMHHWPVGVSQNFKEAVRRYHLSGTQGNTMTQYYLAWSYQYGQGVAKDPSQACHFYHLAADKGNALAQCQLGWCYENGEGTAKDPVEASHLYQLAASQGNAPAQNNLGVCYEKALGVCKARKPAEALQLYRMSASQGYALAQRNLGGRYENGICGIKDRREAFRLFMLSAAQGDTSSKEHLRRLRNSH
ncbi:sel1 repeat family protein [Pelomyxa schiedti]|nr:sel1 repeat family protein [Pelomyxa schiedti]